jgi:hypothetical protein
MTIAGIDLQAPFIPESSSHQRHPDRELRHAGHAELAASIRPIVKCSDTLVMTPTAA